MIYIVLGPGRTGSNLICHMLGSHGLEPSGMLYAARTEDDSQQALDNVITFLNSAKRWRTANIIIHSHDPNVITKLNVNPAECVLILSKRKELFDLIMSHAVTHLTKQWHGYTELQPEPIEFPPLKFVKWYEGFKNWYTDIDLTVPYKQVIEIDYSDIVDSIKGFDYLASVLDIEVQYKDLPKPNPHRYQDWISNWEQLYKLYNIINK